MVKKDRKTNTDIFRAKEAERGMFSLLSFNNPLVEVELEEVEPVVPAKPTQTPVMVVKCWAFLLIEEA